MKKDYELYSTDEIGRRQIDLMKKSITSLKKIELNIQFFAWIIFVELFIGLMWGLTLMFS